MVIRPKKDTSIFSAIKNVPESEEGKQEKKSVQEKPTGYSIATAKDSESK